MAIHRLQGPDGKIHLVEAPDGTDPNQLIAVVQQQLDEENLRRLQKETTGVFETGKRAVARGFGQLGSTFTDVIPAIGGSLLGFNEFAKKQLQEAEEKRAAREAKYPTLFKSYKEVESPFEAPKFAVETIGEQAANMASIIATMLATRGIGLPVAATALGISRPAIASQAAARGLTGEAAEQFVAQRLAATAPEMAKLATRADIGSAFLGSYALNAPEIFENIYENNDKQLAPGASLIWGVGAAALDSILPYKLSRQLTGPMKAGIVEKLLEKSGMDKGILRSVTAGALSSIGTEGLTESAQEAISIAAERFVSENPKIFGSKEWDRIMESGIRGAVAGGAFGTVGGGVEGVRARAEEKEAKRRKEESEQLEKFAAEARQELEAKFGKELAPEEPAAPPAAVSTLDQQLAAFNAPDVAQARMDAATAQARAEIEAAKQRIEALKAAPPTPPAPAAAPKPPAPPVQPVVEDEVKIPGVDSAVSQLDRTLTKYQSEIQGLKGIRDDVKAAAIEQLTGSFINAKGQVQSAFGLDRANALKTGLEELKTIYDTARGKKVAAPAKIAAPTPPAPPAAPAPTPVTLDTIQKIDDPIAFGKLLGIGRTALILKPDGPLAGLDVSTPEGATAAKQVLEAYASGNRSGKIATAVSNYITTRLDPVIAKGAPDVAGIDTTTSGEGVGVPSKRGRRAAPAPVEPVERGGVDVAASDVGQPAAGEVTEPGALEAKKAPQSEEEFWDELFGGARAESPPVGEPTSAPTKTAAAPQAAEAQVAPETQVAPKKTFEVEMATPGVLGAQPRKYVVNADSANEANKLARNMAAEAGHLPPSKSGRATFKAKLAPAPAAPKPPRKKKTAKAAEPVAPVEPEMTPEEAAYLADLYGEEKAPVEERGAIIRRKKATPEELRALEKEGIEATKEEAIYTKTRKKLSLPKYQGPVFNEAQRKLAEAGDVNGLLRNLLDSNQDPAIKQVLRRIRSLNLKTKVVIGDPVGEFALPALREPFVESKYRPSVVEWAKKNFGNREYYGTPVWQNFVAWFGDSQVVNEKGEPLVVYHSSLADIDKFSLDVRDWDSVTFQEDLTGKQKILTVYGHRKNDGKKNIGHLINKLDGSWLLIGNPKWTRDDARVGDLPRKFKSENEAKAFARRELNKKYPVSDRARLVPVFFFSEDASYSSNTFAKEYGNDWRAVRDSSGVMYPVYLSIKNPVDADVPGTWEKFKPFYERAIEYMERNGDSPLPIKDIEEMFKAGRWEVKEGIRGFVDEAKRLGYDGFVSREGTRSAFFGEKLKGADVGGVRVYAAFKPNQIKSAIGNIGTYDPTSPNILYSPRAGSYDPATDTITLDPTNGLNAHTFIHETLHAAISNVLANPNHPLTKQFEKFFISIQDRLGAAYGATDLQEFAAELISNPSFQAVLKSIKAPKSENMFMRVLRSIAEFFGFAPKTTAFEKGLKFINDAIDITNDVPATAAQRLFLGDGKNQSEVVQSIAQAQPSLVGKTLEDTKNFLSNLSNSSVQEMAFGLLRLDALYDLYRKELPSTGMLLNALERRAGAEEKDIARATENFKKFLRVQKQHPAAMRVLNDLAIEISDAQVDVLADKFEYRLIDKAVWDKMTDKQRDDYIMVEAQRKRDYNALKPRYEALPKEVKELYKTIRNDYDAAFNRYRAILEKAAEGSPAVLAKLREEFTLKQPLIGYVPYRRYGDFWLEFIDPDTDMPVGMAFESIRERDQFAANELKGIPSQKYEKLENIVFNQNNIPPTHFLNNVVQKLRSEGASDAQINSVYQAYLAAFPAESVAKQFIKRTGKRGMERDIIRGYNDLMVRWARKLANSEYIPQIDRALIQIAQEGEAFQRNSPDGAPAVGAAVKNIQSQTDFFHNPTYNTLVSGATQLSFFEFMAGNISSAIINLTSLPLMVFPLLTGKFGWVDVMPAMINAGKVATNDWSKNPKYKKLYETLDDHGQLKHTMTREVLEGRRRSAEDYTGLKARFMDALAYPMAASERFNRGLTAIAAFDLAIKNGMTEQQAIEYTLELVKTAHTSGMAVTGPKWMQAPLGRIFFTFKSILWQQGYVLARAFYQAFKGENPKIREAARRQLLATYGMATVFVGVKGMPFYGAMSVMAEILASLFGDEDEPFDFDAFMREVFGEFLYKGAFNYLTNLEVANRAGLATDLVFRDDPRGVAEHGYVLSAMLQMFGPVGSIFMNTGRAVELFKDGQYERSLEAIAPSFVRNGVKGARFLREGALTLKGDPIDEDISAYNSLMQMVGFAPADLSNRYEMLQMGKGFERKVELRRRDALRLYDIAMRSGDTELLEEVRDRIQSFNEKHPKYRITQDSLRRSQRAREAAEKDMIYGVRFNKNLRGEIIDRFFEGEFAGGGASGSF